MSQSVHRPLGSVERLYWLIDLVAGANFVVVAELTGELNESSLRIALDALQARRPLLSVEFIPAGARWVAFRPCEQRLALRTLKLCSGEAWLPFAEEDQAQRFDLQSGPLARCLLLTYPDQHSVVVLTFHHSICDASSGVTVMRDLIRAVSEILSGEPVSIDATSPVAPLEHELSPWLLSARGFVVNTWRMAARWLYWLTTGVPKEIPEDVVVAIAERRDRTVLLEFDEEQTASLIKVCKAAGHTVHAALYSAQVLAVAEEFPERSPVLAVLSLVDLRRRSTPRVENEAMGLRIGFIVTSHRIDKAERSVSLARRIGQSIHRELALDNHRLMLPWLARTSDAIPRSRDGAATLMTRNQKLSPGVSVLSNIGGVAWEPLGRQLTVNAVQFFVPVCGVGNLASSAVTFNGRLRWNFTYSEPSLSKARATALAERAKNLLLSHGSDLA